MSPHMLIPGVCTLRGVNYDNNQLGMWQQRVYSQWNQFTIKIVAALFEEIRITFVINRRIAKLIFASRIDNNNNTAACCGVLWWLKRVGQREKIHIPIDAFVVVVSVEELHFFKRLIAWPIADHWRVLREESVECRGARLLWAKNDKFGQLEAGFTCRPDVIVALVFARILKNTTL